jgi:hypothetical protein
VVVRRLAVSLSLALAGVVLPVAASYAVDPSDLYVASGGDDANECTQAAPCASVQRAIDLAAASGTTIHVGAGTFSGEIEPGAKSVDLDGVSADDTTLTTPQESGDGYVLLVTSGTTALSNLTIEGGLFVDVFVLGGTVTADHVVLDHGGCGLVVTAGEADLTDSTVRDGGQGCIIGPDPGDNGEGLVVVAGGMVSLLRSQVLDPASNSPAVSVSDGSVSADQTFFDNSANDPETSNEEGIRIAHGTATISRSTFHQFGTGVVAAGGTALITDDTFYGNVVGVTSSGGAATVVRSTFQNELASFAQQDTGTLAVAGSVLGHDDIGNCAGVITDLGYNLATDDTCPFTGTSHNDVADLNLDTGLADRGGPTFLPTVAIFWPSSAIDTIPAGATYGDDDTALCPDTSTDLRGVPRPVGGACDAGSLEVAGTETTLAGPGRAAPHDDVTFEATVSVPFVGVEGLENANGSVTFSSGGEVLCQEAVIMSGNPRVATCSTSALGAGKHKVRATFNPSPDSSTLHASTSDPETVLVGTKPAVKAPRTVRMKVGQRVRIVLRASGNPAPLLRKIGGHLPRGLTFHRGHGKATITGRAHASSVGRHRIRVKAVNLMGHDVHMLTLVVERR